MPGPVRLGGWLGSGCAGAGDRAAGCAGGVESWCGLPVTRSRLSLGVACR